MKGLDKQFGGILGKKPDGDSEESGAARDIIDSVKSNDPVALKKALMLFLEECGVYTEEDKKGSEPDEDDGEE